MDIAVVPLDQDGNAVLIEMESKVDVDAPVCDLCGALLGDEAHHYAWHASL